MDSLGLMPPDSPPTEPTSPVVIRLRFEKTGDFAFLSHHDLLRFLTRMCRRADLKVRMAGEFRPTSQISCPSPLPLGLEGLSEVVELEVLGKESPENLLETLRRFCPSGLRLTAAKALPPGTKGRACKLVYEAILNPEQIRQVSESISNLAQKKSWLVHRKYRTKKSDPVSALGAIAEDGSGENNLEEWLGSGTPLSGQERPTRPQRKSPNTRDPSVERPRMVDLKSMVDKIDLAPTGTLRVEANTSDGGTARPEEIFELLGLGNWPGDTPLIRVRVDLADETTDTRVQSARERLGVGRK